MFAREMKWRRGGGKKKAPQKRCLEWDVRLLSGFFHFAQEVLEFVDGHKDGAFFGRGVGRGLCQEVFERNVENAANFLNFGRGEYSSPALDAFAVQE